MDWITPLIKRVLFNLIAIPMSAIGYWWMKKADRDRFFFLPWGANSLQHDVVDAWSRVFTWRGFLSPHDWKNVTTEVYRHPSSDRNVAQLVSKWTSWKIMTGYILAFLVWVL